MFYVRGRFTVLPVDGVFVQFSTILKLIVKYLEEIYMLIKIEDEWVLFK